MADGGKQAVIAPWYVMAYTGLERVAHRHGYALALHGSMSRDLDIVAIPWTDDAEEPEKLLVAVCKFITDKAKVSYKLGKPTQMPHGRLAYVLPVGHDGHYIDFSVMPLVEVSE